MSFTRRLLAYLAILSAAGIAVLIVFPISNRITRLATVVLTACFLFALIVAIWRFRFLRSAAIGTGLALSIFAFWPGRRMPTSEALQSSYVTCLKYYIGTRYVWGGESFTGIDCSGLVRRAMADALLNTGISTASPAAVRDAARLWWNDQTARSLGSGADTIFVTKVPSIRDTSPEILHPGDLAVTEDGIHVLAYLGNGQWIDADPTAEKTRITSVSEQENPWFDDPVRIVRWRWLAD